MKRQTLFILLTFSLSLQAASPFRCSQVYDFGIESQVLLSDFNEYLIVTNDRILGYYLLNDAFYLKEFSTLVEAENFYRRLPNLNKHLLTDMIREKKVLSKRIDLEKFMPALYKLAIEEKGQLFERVKELQSLKEKIADRINSFQQDGKTYRLSDVADTLGYRLTLPFSSRLLKFRSAAEWAQALKLPVSSILEVEIKGSEKDIQKGKYYSAVHLTVQSPQGETLEIQVMSKAMAVWHKWDHTNVYKARLSADEINSLKPYSRNWARLIYDVSQSPSRAERRTKLRAVAAELGADEHEDFFSLVLQIDKALRAQSGVPASKGFPVSQLQVLAEALH